MRTIISLLSFFIIIQTGFCQRNPGIRKTDSLIEMMTLQEKIEMIAGYKNFNIRGIERLGIPPVKMADGPMGVKGHGKATAFPANICMAASWNPELVNEAGRAIGTEAQSKGIGILLAPGVNVYRVPHCGRNFEYYGEDPLLISQMAAAFINGVQDAGVMATIKHFVANNQDYDRHRVSSDIDERTLHEIYFPAFKAAVQKAHVGAIMTSYNLLNGVHTSESEYLIRAILRDQWKFKGIVMSDWISVYSKDAFPAGLDLEMPRAQFMHPDSILQLIQSGEFNEKELDNRVRHIISTCIKHGLYNDHKTEEPDWINHKQTALQIAREGIVLLKNEGDILPLKENEVQKIVLLGPNALYTPYSGGGAAMIDAYDLVPFFEGIQNHSPKNIQVDYLPVEGLYNGYTQVNRDQFSKKLDTVKEYDAVIICTGYNPETEGEGYDRPFALPANQEWLIQKVTDLNPNTVLVINAGGGIFMPWINKVKAILHTWYPGQEAGNALGEIVFGKTSPSGKLPITIEKHWKDNAAFETYDTTHAVLGAKPFYTLWGKPHKIEHMPYNEGIFVGYRHFEKNHIKPLFPFGFGLSYTTFNLKDFSISNTKIHNDESLRIECLIENTGDNSGAEVIQLYIQDKECSHPRPVKELKAFKKVFLNPGEQKTVEFIINKELLQFYNPEEHQWTVEDGDFEILIGTSSNNIEFKQTLTYKSN